MPAIIDIRVTARGFELLKQMSDDFQSSAVRTELNRRWGIQALKWVDRNFRQQGALTGSPWAANRPSTIAAKKSSIVLQNSGKLRQSFTMRVDAKTVSIGSGLFYAEFHEEGRKGPWQILPRQTNRASTFYGPRTGRRFGGFLVFTGSDGKLVFARSVTHPGYPQRRMLPRQTDANFMDQLVETATNYYRQLARSRR